MNTTYKIYAILILFLCPFLGAAQYGCTDVQANNLTSGATINNGSCMYNFTNATYNNMVALSAIVNETSGLIFWRNSFWTHNDSGGANAIYSVDSTTGNIIQTVTITNATNVDWEDIAQDDSYIYIGDFGNNVNGNRTNLRIYKIAKADINLNSTVSVTASILNFSYSDQTNFSATGSNNTDFDCESLIAKGDSLYLFSKNWINNQTRLYRLPKLAGTFSAEYLQTFNVNGLITGADYIASCNRIALVGYNRVLNGATFVWNLFDFNGNNFFAGNKRRIDTDLINTTGQVEAISFIDGNNVYVSRENNAIFGGTQQLMRLNISQFCGNCTGSILNLKLQDLRGENVYGINTIYFKSIDENIVSFELQKMIDGNFTTITTLYKNASGNYMLKDITPTQKNESYRIKAIFKNGNVDYSTILKIKNKLKNVTIFYNKTTNEIFLTQIPDAKIGYTINVHNTNGQQVFTSSVSYVENNKIILNDIVGLKIISIKYTNGFSLTNKLLN
jgi:hypothetical protein